MTMTMNDDGNYEYDFVSTVELDDVDFIGGNVYRWNDYIGEPPEPGGTVSGRYMTPITRADFRDDDHTYYLEIPSCYIDGIHDDILGRINFERVLEDFGDYVIRADWTYTDYLMVRVGSEIPDELVRVIEGLRDYPVYDEDAYSRAEIKAEEEDWSDWGRFELRRVLAALSTDEDFDPDDIEDDLLDEVYRLAREDSVVEYISSERYFTNFKDLAQRVLDRLEAGE